MVDNELILTANKKHTYRFTTSKAIHKKETQQTIKLIISFGVWEIIPTRWVSLESTLYTQGLFTPIADAA